MMFAILSPEGALALFCLGIAAATVYAVYDKYQKHNKGE